MMYNHIFSYDCTVIICSNTVTNHAIILTYAKAEQAYLAYLILVIIEERLTLKRTFRSRVGGALFLPVASSANLS